ncbi:penicillin acylase family protein [Rhizohabitans arisaemae]|uniref:penicillin acylase family protein n=1 Tax=Rhizohabitans arisaemae TaxID=2720610 RepID=UPI0024B11C5B|nr:penicillin acylase family protein [Rhizohabitans arisaemae]
MKRSIRAFAAVPLAAALATTAVVAAGPAMGIAGVRTDPPAPTVRPRIDAGAADTTGAPAFAGSAPTAGTVVLRRTEHGIPHVLAATYRDLGYGAGFAYAQDNLCALADAVLTVSGERSRWFGPEATAPDGVGNLDSDVHHTAVNESATVESLLARPQPLGPSPQARELMRGYAAGANAYLARQGVAHLPDPTCRGAGWVRPITELDLWRRAYQIAGLNGVGAFRAEIATAAPPGTGPAARPKGTAPTAARPGAAPVRRVEPPAAGSNAWAIGRAATVAGTGMLLANPHLPWRNDLRFYQIQLTIPGRLNVSGATFGGLPVVVLGHTDRLAWMHTISTAIPNTLTQLTLAPGDPTRYVVDGRARRMAAGTVSVPVRRPDGSIAVATRTLYRTPDGPVVQIPGLLDWSTTTAFVLHDANAGNLRLVDQWLAVNHGQSIADLRAAQARHQGLPWVNTLAADSTGTTLYNDVQVVPAVDDALQRRCATPAGADIAAATGVPVLDGSRGDCGWAIDPTAVEPGLFGPAALPSLVRTDFVANSNDSPWLANPAQPLTGFPRIVGTTGTPLSLRSRLSLDMLTRRRAGTDGLGRPGFTLDTVQQTMFGNRNHSAELGRDAVVAMCTAHPVLAGGDGSPVDVRAGCAALAGWDTRGGASSRGAVLWREFFIRALGAAGDAVWRTPFDPAQPLTTPRDLATDRPDVRAALADAVRFFAHANLRPDLALGDAQRYLSIPIHGCTQAEGCFNAIEPPGGLGSDGVYPDVSFGTGFLMAVEVGPAGPRARTLTVYSQSANPRSPFHTDQTRRYAAGQWITERYTEAEIGADPALTVRYLNTSS